MREQSVSPDSDVYLFCDAERQNCTIVHHQYVRGAEMQIIVKDECRDKPNENAL